MMIRLLLAIAAVIAEIGCPVAASAQTAGAGAAALALEGCASDLKYLNQITGWQVRWPQELARLASAPKTRRAAALEDWRGAAAALSQDRAALRASQAGAAPAPVVLRVLAQMEALAASPLAPGLREPAWRDLLDEELRPAIRTYGRFLRNEYLPRAPVGSGLANSPTGTDCFERAAKTWTSRTLSTSAIEAMGAELMSRYRRELADLADVDQSQLPALLATLRDPDRYGDTSRDDIVRISRSAIDRAAAAIPRWFDGPSPGPLKIEPIERSLEVSLPAGYFEPAQGAADAVYRINLSNPSGRRAMAEVIAFHEGLPGHALAFDRAAGRGTFSSGFVEGWAIYAEHLADEMKLYSGIDDRIGKVAKHLWAASRLIVEPGLHVRGWSRDSAIAFMRDNTALPLSEIEIEVDRYLAMPGQSLSYMVGYESIRRARASSEQKAGAAFDLRAFHHTLLAAGPRPLDQLEREFE